MKNTELWKRATEVMPGMHSNLRAGGWGSYGLENPLFMVKGKGARVTDVEGRTYIDYALGLGPGILGHGNEEYKEALKRQIDSMCFATSGLYGVLEEVEWAEKFVKHVPCAEKVRLCVTGTDAVQLAIRLARAYTGRRYFIRFDGHYHGWLDNVLGGTVNEHPIGMPFAYESATDRFGTEGRDPEAFLQSFKLPWNDIETLETVLKKYGEQIALVIMEAINCNGGCCHPRPGYLERVRELCDKYGVVLCFDEVITGFRVGLSGAQGTLGVTPDISTFGKSIAAGVPVSAVAGKRQIMDLLAEGRVVGVGTFNGYPLGLAACLATIQILEKDNGTVYKHIERMQKKLTNGLKDLAKKHSLPVLIQGPRGAFNMYFIDGDKAYTSAEIAERGGNENIEVWRNLLADEGVLLMRGARWYMCTAITEDDITHTLECADRAMAKLK